jgi:hypothetical protein
MSGKSQDESDEVNTLFDVVLRNYLPIFEDIQLL